MPYRDDKCPEYRNYHFLEMYQLHETDFYLNLTLGDEFSASNIVFFHFFCNEISISKQFIICAPLRPKTVTKT